MDEKLKQTIERIERLAAQNEAFGREMRRLFGGASMQPVRNDKIDRIERYLALDYELNEAKSVIDYTFIKDVHIRKQLIADNREMLRHRYGVRAHKIDFEEFCRYAHLQAEMLLNYYYKTKFKDDKKIIDEIKLQLNKEIPQENGDNSKWTTLSNVPFDKKLRAFCFSLFIPKENYSYTKPPYLYIKQSSFHTEQPESSMSKRF